MDPRERAEIVLDSDLVMGGAQPRFQIDGAHHRLIRNLAEERRVCHELHSKRIRLNCGCAA
jgi:hypothetical protein